MSRYREQITAALQAVTIRGPTRFAWLGRASPPLPASQNAAMNEPERRSYLVACLREELYGSFYCHGRPVAARWGEPEPAAADPWVVAAMSEANTGSGSWQTGWKVERVEGGELTVASARLRARIAAADCRAPSGGAHPGADVSVRLPKELPDVSPGFYTAVSEAPGDLSSSASIVRVYWNIDVAGAAKLVATLTSRLNATKEPFRLKVANHPSRFRRCDAAVLYLPSDSFRALRESLREIAATLSPHLRRDIPAFTLELASGVGLAEGVADGGSFGVGRCALLADGIVRAHARGITRADRRLAVVAARFAEDEVPIDAPYLEPSLAGRHVL